MTTLLANGQTLKKVVAPYQTPEMRRSLWQIANSLLPYLLLWYLMYRSLAVSYWLTLALAVPTAGFMVRIFIIFHDCGHGSFFKSHRANAFVGIVTGLLTLTPYYEWRNNHAIHHATAGDLDRRGVGDVKTLTVKDYQALPLLRKIGYRIMRNPLVMFTIGAWLVFILFHRFPGKKGGKREKWGVLWTDLALAGLVVLMGILVGFKEFLLVQLPIVMLGTSIGVWLFYVQHNFEGTYWERHEKWNFIQAGLQGSSYYQLPKWLQWFTGNIGFHHIHHLSPRIPNYKLNQCHQENPFFQQVKPLTIRNSLKSLRFRFWDEENHKMVGYEALK